MPRITPVVALLCLALAGSAMGAPALAAPPAVPASEPLLLLRYAVVVGGRASAAAPAPAGVLGQSELQHWLAEWEPDVDSEEARRVFAANELGEVIRQAAVLAAGGGEVVATVERGGTRFDVRLAVRPDGINAASVQAEVARDGQVLLAPQTRIPLAERSVLSSAGGADVAMAFLVLQLDRTTRAALAQRPLKGAWRGAEKMVEGHRIVPPRLLESTPAVYPEEAKSKRTQGQVTLALRLDEQGKIGDIEVVQGLPDGLTEAAIAAVKTWKYAPATEGGFPVAVRVTVTLEFRLDEREVK